MEWWNGEMMECYSGILEIHTIPFYLSSIIPLFHFPNAKTTNT